MRAVFDAAAAKVEEAGALLAGGHTIRDDEPKYGLAVIGTAHPDAIWRKSGARPGDVLYLTKPLGTGLVLTGVRKKILGEGDLQAAAATMTELNDRAAETLRPFEPSAVTDVTGFGSSGMRMRWPSGVASASCSTRRPSRPSPGLDRCRARAAHGRRPAEPGLRRGRGPTPRPPPRSSTSSVSTLRRRGDCSSRSPRRKVRCSRVLADAGLQLARIGLVVEGTGLALA